MADLNALLERVKAATGPDDEIEARLWCELNGKRYQGHFIGYGGDDLRAEYTEPPKRTRLVSREPVPRVTASIDAALALTERVLPGFGYSLNGGHLRDQATIWLGEVETYDQECEFVEEAATAPIAILAATLAALIASEPKP